MGQLQWSKVEDFQRIITVEDKQRERSKENNNSNHQTAERRKLQYRFQIQKRTMSKELERKLERKRIFNTKQGLKWHGCSVERIDTWSCDLGIQAYDMDFKCRA